MAAIKGSTGLAAGNVPITIVGNPFAELPPRPAVRDLDGDGVADFTAGANGGTLPAWSASGQVPITVQGNPFIGTEPKGNPAFRDLDGDGDLDFALGANGGPPPARGQIPITVQGNPFAALDAGRDSAPAFMDVDGDGRADLVLGAADGTVQVWSARGNIPITVNGNPFAAIDVGGNSKPAFVDLDGDGDLDLVVGARDGTLRSWRNDGGAFTALTGRENPFAGIDCGGNSAPAFMDVNGDEMLDLVLGGRDGTLQVWSLAGTLPITVRANPFAGIDVGADSTPSFVDLDRDGDLDLVVGARDGTLRTWRNDGGTFTALTGRENPFAGIDAGGNSAPAFADLDGDGTLDLLFGGRDGTLSGGAATDAPRGLALGDLSPIG